MPITACELLYDPMLPFYAALGFEVGAVLTDNGREFCGRPDAHPASGSHSSVAKKISHIALPKQSPTEPIDGRPPARLQRSPKGDRRVLAALIGMADDAERSSLSHRHVQGRGKNPEDLTRRQTAKLSDIARINKPLYRAYLLKEQLREIFRLTFRARAALLDHCLAWAQRSRLAPSIVTSLRYGLTNARIESVNTRIRVLTRIAFGFHSAQPLTAIVMLALGGLCPPLPGGS